MTIVAVVMAVGAALAYRVTIAATNAHRHERHRAEWKTSYGTGKVGW